MADHHLSSKSNLHGLDTVTSPTFEAASTADEQVQ